MRIEEYGYSEKNAGIIAHEILRESKLRNDIVFVSASKGGLQTAMVLGGMLNDSQLKKVSTWVNIGGILNGSPIADQYLKAPKCWFAVILLKTKGLEIQTVRDISHKYRSETFKKLKFPNHINTIHFLGMPLTSQVHKRIRKRYCSIQRDFGPNDGLTTIPDALTSNGVVISELGLDHYFKDENIDMKTLALAMLLLDNK